VCTAETRSQWSLTLWQCRRRGTGQDLRGSRFGMHGWWQSMSMHYLEEITALAAVQLEVISANLSLTDRWIWWQHSVFLFLFLPYRKHCCECWVWLEFHDVTDLCFYCYAKSHGSRSSAVSWCDRHCGLIFRCLTSMPDRPGATIVSLGCTPMVLWWGL
jgi:hypothetical protein